MGLRLRAARDGSVASPHEDYAVSLEGMEQNLTQEELLARVRSAWQLANRGTATAARALLLGRGKTSATVRVFYAWD